jgi:hypothetical protein
LCIWVDVVAGAAGGRRVEIFRVSPTAAASRTAQKRTKCHLAFGDSRLGSKSVTFFSPSDDRDLAPFSTTLSAWVLQETCPLQRVRRKTRGERRHRSQKSGKFYHGLIREDASSVGISPVACCFAARAEGISNATHLSSKPPSVSRNLQTC